MTTIPATPRADPDAHGASEPRDGHDRATTGGPTATGENWAAADVATPPLTARDDAWNTRGEWARLWLYAFAVYSGLAVLTGSANVGYLVTSSQHIFWHSLIWNRVLEEYSCALFVPPLFWLVHRFPIDRHRWHRNVPVLLAATLACVIVKYTFVFLPLSRLVLPGEDVPLLTELVQNTVPVMIDFWAVIGVAHAVEFYRQAQDRARIAAQLRGQLSQAQLEVLRSQLHPHFLFNTLNGIATLMHRDVDAADQMLTDLGELLRATLQHHSTHEITVEQEIALLERYLAIARTRFHDRLTVSYDVPAAVCDALVPQFLLQPLVENALEHGIARHPGPGRVDIAIRCAADRLVITVRDDGPGLGTGAGTGHGVGLANTRRRLRELYGTAQQLTLAPVSTAGGVEVMVVVPYHRRPVPSDSPVAALADHRT